MPYELPEDQHAARRRFIWRWVSFALVALLGATLAYLGYVGWVGSEQAVEPPVPSTDCRTPGIAYGWMYEAINYDPDSDVRLTTITDPTRCELPPARAGDDLVTSDGVSLAAWYIPAAGGDEGRPTIVLAHGHGTNKSSMLERAALLHDDYNLVLFDFRNHGQSEDARTTVGLLERLDLRAVIDWLEATKAPPTIGVLGVSMGGAAAINEAAGDQRVRAVVLDSTHATLANALQARIDQLGYPLGLPGAWSILFGGLIRTGQDMSAADPVEAVERYGRRPLLIIGGGQEDAMGATDAQDLASAASAGGAEVEIEICEPAGGHAQSMAVCAGEYRAWVLGFFGRTFDADG